MPLLTNFLSQPLVRFLLTLGVIGVAYAWIWLPIVQNGIGGVWTKFVKKGKLGTSLTITVGHGLLALAIVSAAWYSMTRGPNVILLAALGAVFFWVTTIPDLFEEHAPSAAQEKTHPFTVLLRLLLLIAWICAVVFGIFGAFDGLNTLFLETRTWVGQMWNLPYNLGMVLGIIGVYGLFRSLFKAFFATIGVFGLIFHPGPPKVTL